MSTILTTIDSSLSTLISTLYTLHITHYSLHIKLYTLHTTHYSLHITHYTLLQAPITAPPDRHKAIANKPYPNALPFRRDR